MIKGSREVTIYDVAKALHISPSTVSRGLKDHPYIKKSTREKIKAVAKEMGYRRNPFATSLSKKRTETIGVVVPRLNSYFQATAIAGIEKVTNEHGYGLLISQSQESERKEIACISTLYNSRVDGMIISLAFETKKLDHFNILLDRNIPVVFFDRVTDYPGSTSVIIDNYKAGYEITGHLIRQGCRRIVHLGGSLLRNVYNDRFNGYRQALTDNKIKYDPALLIISDLTHDAGIKAAHTIAGMRPVPDGVFAANDASAVAVICTLQKTGINIPGDIAVAGFNNEPLCQVVQPNLTTIEYPAKEIGEVAATALINKLTNKDTGTLSTIVLKHKLVIRESTLREESISK